MRIIAKIMGKIVKYKNYGGLAVFVITTAMFNSLPDNVEVFTSFKQLFLSYIITVNLYFFFGLFTFFVRATTYRKYLSEMFFLVIMAASNIVLFAAMYRVYGINGADEVVYGVAECLYFSIVTWTTLGYGDFSPTVDVRFFAAIEALLGYTYMAIIIGLGLTVFNRTYEEPEETKLEKEIEEAPNDAPAVS